MKFVLSMVAALGLTSTHVAQIPKRHPACLGQAQWRQAFIDDGAPESWQACQFKADMLCHSGLPES